MTTEQRLSKKNGLSSNWVRIYVHKYTSVTEKRIKDNYKNYIL